MAKSTNRREFQSQRQQPLIILASSFAKFAVEYERTACGYPIPFAYSCGTYVFSGAIASQSSMEGGDSILDVLYEEDNYEDDQDVEMLDVEEGELVEHNSQNDSSQIKCKRSEDVDVTNQESQSKNRRRKANKKKNKRKRSGSDPIVTDINRFVLDTCRRLKEKKSYMVYTAVGCLGVSALCDIIKEVDAIQSCGGQMTADGRRFRTGGGILWNIIKAREPKAYKEIMRKAKEFEKQFKRPNIRQATEEVKEVSSNVNETLQPTSDMQHQDQQSNDEGKRVAVHDRLRIPVSYDDDLLGAGSKDDVA
ncbi:hypothetical protein FNV43_RR12691 [Rhamnella rubrinervis]|uniref:Phosphorylated adapter RNA export protein n=1 Tax=Rhamnella rubrinervis TaxID=2594499 RepID=A0A8K0H867_9ROSA|nr:hypothetical protein FNV43_RR12691 [Rhamnella rubrinervis]